MQKILIGAVLAVVLVGGGVYMMSAPGQGEEQLLTERAAMEEKVLMEKAEMEKAEMMAKEEAEMKESMMSEETMMDDTDAMMKKEDETMSEGDAMMKKVGVYAPYEASKLAMADSGDVVLFFKAAWCPSCRALDSNIKANLEAIPSDLTILELDYDTATALKQKYGVTTQHTLVQVDANGTLIKKWSGGSTLASIVEQIQ